MARPSSTESSLAADVQVSGGLQQFRTVAQGSREARDNPFGGPVKAAAPAPAREAPPATEPPKVESIRPEPKPAASPPREPRIARQKVEAEPVELVAAVYAENVTVPLSEALRDRSEELAKVINRNRSVRKQRITRNSIIRVALQVLLDDFSHLSAQSLNSEEELLQAARSRRKR